MAELSELRDSTYGSGNVFRVGGRKSFALIIPIAHAEHLECMIIGKGGIVPRHVVLDRVVSSCNEKIGISAEEGVRTRTRGGGIFTNRNCASCIALALSDSVARSMAARASRMCSFLTALDFWAVRLRRSALSRSIS